MNHRIYMVRIQYVKNKFLIIYITFDEGIIRVWYHIRFIRTVIQSIYIDDGVFWVIF